MKGGGEEEHNPANGELLIHTTLAGQEGKI